jgi:hypothetical protein
MSKIIYSLLTVLLFSNCSSDTVEPNRTPLSTETLYFPPLNSTTWETKAIASLG